MKATNEIPLIDFGPFLAGSAAGKQKVADEIFNAAHYTGFMYLRNVGIATMQVEAMFALAREFFGRDMNEKRKSLYSSDENFGYGAVAKESLDPGFLPDLKETFTMRDVLRMSAQAELWPDERFRQMSVDFFSQCCDCARNIMRAFALALKLDERFFDELHTGKNQTLRLLNYPPERASADEQLGAGAHTDYGTLTLLFQDDCGGLQVKNAAGEWVHATPKPETVVINTGDLTQRWSNDILRSTPHRVIRRAETADRPRQSIAFFSDPDPEVLVETIPSCIRADNPQKYPPITAGQHIREKILAAQYY